MSAPVHSSVLSGTSERDKAHPKNVSTFFFNYQIFEGVEAPEDCKKVAQIFTTFLLRKLCSWRLNWLEGIQQIYPDM